MNSIFANFKKLQKHGINFFQQGLKKLKRHAFILFSSVEKLKNYGNIFASSQNIDLIFYMLEKAQKYGFGK